MPRFTHKFKQEHSLDDRKRESAQVRAKNPDRVPIICERLTQSTIPAVEKTKYLVQSDLTVGQFVYAIRKRIRLSSDQAIYLFVNGIIPPSGALMANVYEEHKDEDGFLYLAYSGESTFGAVH